MDSSWQEWRHLEEFWERFEEKGWELGPIRYVNLPPVLAEFGPYRIVFRYREPGTGEDLFELSEMYEGEEYRAVLVWGVPTSQEAQSLLEDYGARPEELPEAATAEADARAEGFWSELMPPVVYARESRRSDKHYKDAR